MITLLRKELYVIVAVWFKIRAVNIWFRVGSKIGQLLAVTMIRINSIRFRSNLTEQNRTQILLCRLAKFSYLI